MKHPRFPSRIHTIFACWARRFKLSPFEPMPWLKYHGGWFRIGDGQAFKDPALVREADALIKSGISGAIFINGSWPYRYGFVHSATGDPVLNYPPPAPRKPDRPGPSRFMNTHPTLFP